MVVRPVHTSASSGSYARYAGGNHDGGQAGAVIESIGSYTRHAVGNREGGQAGAIRESSVPYARHTGGNRDGGQAGAVIESALSYARYAVLRFFLDHLLWYNHATRVFVRVTSYLSSLTLRFKIVINAINFNPLDSICQ